MNNHNKFQDFILVGELRPISIEKLEKWVVNSFGSNSAEVAIALQPSRTEKNTA